jgi:hypothetical protein
MARAPSLKPQLNQIRTWVGEGVTDIWIAHQLSVTPAQIADFRRKQGLLRPDETPAPSAPRAPRAAAVPKAAAKPRAPRKPKADAQEPAASDAETVADGEQASTDDATAKRRRRGRRGGRGRGKTRVPSIPAALEHGADGVVLRIDAAVLDSEAYREHWAEITSGMVTITASGITLSMSAPVDLQSAAAPDDDDAGDDDATADD